MSEWKKIETAPKDRVSVFDLWAGRQYPDCTWARPTYSAHLPKNTYCFVQLDASYDCNGPVDEEVKNPTHWMAIPDGPKG